MKLIRSKKASESIEELIKLPIILIIVAMVFLTVFMIFIPFWNAAKVHTAIESQNALAKEIGTEYCSQSNAQFFTLPKKFMFPDEAYAYYMTYDAAAATKNTLWVSFDRNKIDVEDSGIGIEGCNMPIFIPESASEQEAQYQKDLAIDIGVNAALIALTVATMGGGTVVQGAYIAGRTAKAVESAYEAGQAIRTTGTISNAGKIARTNAIFSKVGSKDDAALLLENHKLNAETIFQGSQDKLREQLNIESADELLNFMSTENVIATRIETIAGGDTLITVSRTSEALKTTSASDELIDFNEYKITVDHTGEIKSIVTSNTKKTPLAKIIFGGYNVDKIIGIGSFFVLGYKAFTSGCKEVSFELQKCNCKDYFNYDDQTYNSKPRVPCVTACMKNIEIFGYKSNDVYVHPEIVALVKTNEEGCV